MPFAGLFWGIVDVQHHDVIKEFPAVYWRFIPVCVELIIPSTVNAWCRICSSMSNARWWIGLIWLDIQSGSFRVMSRIANRKLGYRFKPWSQKRFKQFACALNVIKFRFILSLLVNLMNRRTRLCKFCLIQKIFSRRSKGIRYDLGDFLQTTKIRKKKKSDRRVQQIPESPTT